MQDWERSTIRLCIVILFFNFYAEPIIRDARLDKLQAGIKIARKYQQFHIHADDTTLVAESEEVLISLLMKVKEESDKTGLKLHIKKKLRSWQLVPFSSVQLLSHVRFYNPMNRRMPGLPVHHQLPEFIQIHVHWVGDAF